MICIDGGSFPKLVTALRTDMTTPLDNDSAKDKTSFESHSLFNQSLIWYGKSFPVIVYALKYIHCALDVFLDYSNRIFTWYRITSNTVCVFTHKMGDGFYLILCCL